MENLIQGSAHEDDTYSQAANGLKGQDCESLEIC